MPMIDSAGPEKAVDSGILGHRGEIPRESAARRSGRGEIDLDPAGPLD